MVNIDPEDAENVACLTNVKDIGFYDTSGADIVLKHASGLPIESLFFEVSHVSTTIHFEPWWNSPSSKRSTAKK